MPPTPVLFLPWSVCLLLLPRSPDRLSMRRFVMKNRVVPQRRVVSTGSSGLVELASFEPRNHRSHHSFVRSFVRCFIRLFLSLTPPLSAGGHSWVMYLLSVGLEPQCLGLTTCGLQARKKSKKLCSCSWPYYSNYCRNYLSLFLLACGHRIIAIAGRGVAGMTHMPALGCAVPLVVSKTKNHLLILRIATRDRPAAYG